MIPILNCNFVCSSDYADDVLISVGNPPYTVPTEIFIHHHDGYRGSGGPSTGTPGRRIYIHNSFDAPLPRASESPRIVTIPVSTVFSGSELDGSLPDASYTNKIYQSNGHTIAVRTTVGDLHFLDFPHSGRPFPEFWYIVDDAFGFKEVRLDVLAERNVLSAIKDLNPFKLEKVTVSFDKEQYIKEAETVINNWKLQFTESIDFLASTKASVALEERDKYKEELAKVTSSEYRFENVKCGLKLASLLKDWTVFDKGVKYNKSIFATRVKYRNAFIELAPIGLADKYYLEGLTMRFCATLPNTPSSKVTAVSHFHPNIGEDGSQVCLGDLYNKPFEEAVTKIVASLETINLDSAFNGHARRELCKDLEVDLETDGLDDNGDEIELDESESEVWTVT